MSQEYILFSCTKISQNSLLITKYCRSCLLFSSRSQLVYVCSTSHCVSYSIRFFWSLSVCVLEYSFLSTNILSSETVTLNSSLLQLALYIVWCLEYLRTVGTDLT